LKVLYLTRDYSPHDERFLTALGLTGHEVNFLRLEPGKALIPPHGVTEIFLTNDDPNIRLSSTNQVAALSQVLDVLSPDVLHAGPLHGPAYIAALSGFPRLVSMSWGADILHDAEVSADRPRRRLQVHTRSQRGAGVRLPDRGGKSG